MSQGWTAKLTETTFYQKYLFTSSLPHHHAFGAGIFLTDERIGVGQVQSQQVLNKYSAVGPPSNEAGFQQGEGCQLATEEYICGVIYVGN